MPINASSLEGTAPPGVVPPLPANIAYTNVANSFIKRQTITPADTDGPSPYYALEVRGPAVLNGAHAGIIFNQPNQAIDAKKFRIISYADHLRFEAVADSEGSTIGGETFLDRAGNFTVANNLKAGSFIVAGTCVRAVGARGAPPSTGGGIELFFQSGSGYLHGYNITTSSYTPIIIYGEGVRIGRGDLYVDGGGAQVFGPIYPGRYDTTWGIQTSWYLASHGSYGLFSNTGLYLSGGLTVVSTSNFIGLIRLACDVWHISGEGNQRLHFTTSGITYIQGSGITFRNNAQVDTFIVDSGGNANCGGVFKCGWGYACRAGVYGAYSGNYFNYQWTGAIQCWIDASYFGDITLASDARLKRDFTPLVGSLDKVLQMRPGTFYFKPMSEDAEADPHLRLGLLAQDVQEVAPELVRNTGMKTYLTPDGLQQINYLEMIPMLVAAIKELNQKVEEKWKN